MLAYFEIDSNDRVVYFFSTNPKLELAHCLSEKTYEHTILLSMFHTFYVFYILLHFGDIFAAFVVIFIKNKQDILTGFNKLDGLIKVSIF